MIFASGLAGRLYRIKAKTLIVWGESDKLIAPACAERFAEGITDVEPVMVPEAGHLLSAEIPDRVAEAIAKLG